MSFRNFKADSFCVGGRLRSATKDIFGDETTEGSKILIGYCSLCNRKKSMTVSDYTIQAERLGRLLKNFCYIWQKIATNVLKNPSRALDVTANIATLAASRNPKSYYQHCPKWSHSTTKEKGFTREICISYAIKMEAKKDSLFPSAPLETNDLVQRLGKKLTDVNSFNNHINNIKEVITHLEDKNHKPKKRYKNYKTLNTILESVHTIVLIGATSTSITLSITGIVLIVLPISAGIACAVSLSNKVLHEIIINKYNKKKKQYDIDQQTIKTFDKWYRKSLQDNVTDKNEYESLCNFLTNYLDETKNKIFSLTWT